MLLCLLIFVTLFVRSKVLSGFVSVYFSVLQAGNGRWQELNAERGTRTLLHLCGCIRGVMTLALERKTCQSAVSLTV